uniref:Uncharacterized protein n=1 Tax=Rhizophora mucronata TaxID=61149 RepID=A0A2P2QKW9_RHIMU
MDFYLVTLVEVLWFLSHSCTVSKVIIS